MSQRAETLSLGNFSFADPTAREAIWRAGLTSREKDTKPTSVLPFEIVVFPPDAPLIPKEKPLVPLENRIHAQRKELSSVNRDLHELNIQKSEVARAAGDYQTQRDRLIEQKSLLAQAQIKARQELRQFKKKQVNITPFPQTDYGNAIALVTTNYSSNPGERLAQLQESTGLAKSMFKKGKITVSVYVDIKQQLARMMKNARKKLKK